LVQSACRFMSQIVKVKIDGFQLRPRCRRQSALVPRRFMPVRFEHGRFPSLFLSSPFWRTVGLIFQPHQGRVCSSPKGVAMVVRRQFHTGDNGPDTAPALPVTTPTLVGSRNPDIWRLRGMRLSLHATVEKSVVLRAVIKHEHIKRECQALERLLRVLDADAKLVRSDPAARHRVAMRVAAFYQRLGELERTIDTLSQELNDRAQSVR